MRRLKMSKTAWYYRTWDKMRTELEMRQLKNDLVQGLSIYILYLHKLNQARAGR
jgi:hypothetical protein